MKFTNLKEYLFSSYNVKGFLSDFSLYSKNSIIVKIHEETINKNEIPKDTNILEFEPIVLALYPNKILSNNQDIETDRLLLLDGHHRWKYANQIESIHKLKCILVNFEDIQIKSYNFKLNLDIQNFDSFLLDSGFDKTENTKVGIKFKNTFYSSPNHDHILELYKFKKILQDNETIIPILDDSVENTNLISFSPISPEDLLNITELLPPKSTWITPRI